MDSSQVLHITFSNDTFAAENHRLSLSKSFWKCEVKVELDKYLANGNVSLLKRFTKATLESSAPSLAHCILEMIMSDGINGDKIFALLDLMEELLKEMGDCYIRLFENEICEIVSKIYKKFPILNCARNELKTRWKSWARYFSASKISQIHERCSEILQTEFLMKKLEENEKALESTEKMNKNLESTVKNQRSKIFHKDNGLQKLKEDLDKTAKQLKQVNSELEKSNEILKIENKNLSTRVINENSKIRNLEIKLKRKDEQLEKQEKFIQEISTLNLKVEESAIKIQQLEQTIMHSEEQAKNHTNEILGLKSLNENQNLKIYELQAQLVENTLELKTQLTEKEDKYKYLENLNLKEISELQLIIDQRTLEISKLNQQVLNSDTLKLEIEQKLQRREEENIRLKTELQENQRTAHQQLGQINAHIAKIEQLEQQKSKKDNELEQLKTELIRQRKQAVGFVSVNKRLDERLAVVKVELCSEKNETFDISKELEKVQLELKTKEDDLALSKIEVRKLTTIKAVRETKIEGQKLEISKLKTALEKFNLLETEHKLLVSLTEINHQAKIQELKTSHLRSIENIKSQYLEKEHKIIQNYEQNFEERETKLRRENRVNFSKLREQRRKDEKKIKDLKNQLKKQREKLKAEQEKGKAVKKFKEQNRVLCKTKIANIREMSRLEELLKQKERLIISSTEETGLKNSRITELDESLRFYRRKIDSVQSILKNKRRHSSGIIIGKIRKEISKQPIVVIVE